MHVCVRVISLKHLAFIILPSSPLPSFLLSSPLPASHTICDVGERPLKVGNRHEERLRNQEEEVRVDINPPPGRSHHHRRLSYHSGRCPPHFSHRPSSIAIHISIARPPTKPTHSFLAPPPSRFSSLLHCIPPFGSFLTPGGFRLKLEPDSCVIKLCRQRCDRLYCI